MEATVLPAQPASFDYTALDAETRIVVQQRTTEIKTIARRAATDIIEIGTKLIEVKERLGHGNFGNWLKAEFGWSQDTAANFMHVTVRFGQIPNNSEFAPTALYMLSGGNVPEEARVEALARAEAGEKITVKAAETLVQTYAPRWASVEALTAVIREWLTAWEDPIVKRAVVKTMVEQIAAGPFQLDRLLRSGKLPAPFKREDVFLALRGLLAELERPAGRAVVWSPADAVDAVDVVDATVDGQGPARLDTAMYATNAATTCAVGTLELSAPALSAVAPGLQPAVWHFLGLAPTATQRGPLLQAQRMTGSLLDLEGFHAQRGRNFDWEALIGTVGAGVEQAALRLAVGQVRAEIVGRLEGLPEVEVEVKVEAEAEAKTETTLTAAVEKWLADLAEANEIPTDRNGAPEQDATRLVLRNVLHNRSNGGAAAWRQLRQHPAWPAGTPDTEKLAAVRVALLELTGEPERGRGREGETVREGSRPPSWAGMQPSAGGNGAARAGDRPERARVDPAVIAASVQRSSLVAKVTLRLHHHFDNLLAYAAAQPEADPALAELLVELQGILDLLD